MKEKIMRQTTPLADYLRILYRGRWGIVACFVVVLAIALYLNVTAVPLYQADAKVMVKVKSNLGLPPFDGSAYWQMETMISNQIEILRGRAIAKAVAQKLLESPYAAELPLLQAHGHVKSRWQRLMEAAGRLLGRSVADTARHRPAGRRLQDVETLARSLSGYLSIEPIRNTDMILISAVSEHPREAMLIANAYVEAFSDLNRAMSQAEVRQVKTFLENQLNVIQQQLAESERALKDFTRAQKTLTLPDDASRLVEKLVEFESLYKESLAELESQRARLRFIDSQLGRKLELEVTAATSYLEELKREMAALQQERAVQVAYLVNNGNYDEKNPRLQQLDEQIHALTQKFKDEFARHAAAEPAGSPALQDELYVRKFEVEASLQALQPKVASLQEIVADYTRRLESLPEKKLVLAQLQRSAQVDENIYLMMKQKYEELRITEVGQLGDVRIIEPAELPEAPLGPNKRLNLILGMVFGLSLGVGLAFLLDMLDSSVRTVEDLERMGQPVLGSIPLIKEDKALQLLKISLNGSTNGATNGSAHPPDNDENRRKAARLISHFAPQSPIAEAYRTLRTGIQYTHFGSPLRTLLVTSPGPGDGKSTTVANLAIVMAQSGSKVLLIDADLRRPVLHHVFKLDRRLGLSNVLAGHAAHGEAIAATEIDNLHVMTCGTLPPNPSELLGSSTMQRLMETLKAEYEILLFDSPPAIAVTDAAVLARLVDGVFLVVKAGQTSKEATFQTFKLLQQMKARFLGTLLNSVKMESLYGSYYYYYHYHYHANHTNGKLPKQQRKLPAWS
ncbi:MAG: polysaccharide biosynthesis tyrosine autokinase [candidate division KSB1 bacterium]|nr:polysaccharide biosynthesis tyrosine autokinase [candidate division KSB1 bacterium]MDZ7276125.1 polysaccharide biosynthesis tyrosine autokinase [candidate division KSB1 bacterium]MDZ7287095.1 polysaccharide biosynthesis tyrosine autokinase [candidate division KSB1 bacterium]MDZ7296980.1 polysaccharide biosynthesis tyrosine autokinase [candidate division KSB1 bacterium]MDZ7306191.1 polysaccharide biosynthesis tyrosine autokinase [candidate division KSB1 bacterium]